jgi:transcriptional regulator GlxA family with amidase domain
VDWILGNNRIVFNSRHGRRLEVCARSLQSSAHRNRSVTAIAFDHGFNSPTHFGRVFRDKFNMTPREFRREKGGLA